MEDSQGGLLTMNAGKKRVTGSGLANAPPVRADTPEHRAFGAPRGSIRQSGPVDGQLVGSHAELA